MNARSCRAIGISLLVLLLGFPPSTLAQKTDAIGRLRYNDVQQRSMHNAYWNAESIMDQLIYHRIRNMEWDLRSQPVTNIYGPPRDDNDWHVYHAVHESRRCDKLSDCLRLLRAFHDAVPRHEVFTLTLEFKGHDRCANPLPPFHWTWLSRASSHPFPVYPYPIPLPLPAGYDPRDPTKQTPEGLDARLRAHLGSALFTPADLLRSCPTANTLQEAITKCGWPTLEALRGKIIVHVLAYNEEACHWIPLVPGPPSVTELALTLDYAPDNAVSMTRVAFSAPLIYWWEGFDAEGNIKAIDDRPWIVSFTEVSPDRASEFRQQYKKYQNFILRSGEANDPEKFNEYQNLFQLINMDHTSFDLRPWARTHNAYGYPFCPIGVTGDQCWTSPHALSQVNEIGNLIEIGVASGDIWDYEDDFVFANRRHSAAGSTNPGGPPTFSWEAFISNASNNRVHSWEKGCLMARADLSRNSAYYAVCRAGDDRELFVQVRNAAGLGTAQFEANFGDDGFDGEDAIFVRLDLWQLADRTMLAQGYGSADGKTWEAIGPIQSFGQYLELQGLAASSHGPDWRNPDGSLPRFFFGNVETNDADRTAEIPTWPLDSIGNVSDKYIANRRDVAFQFELRTSLPKSVPDHQEGEPFVDIPLGTFTDTRTLTAADYTATIDWGDGRSDAGTIRMLPDDSFEVRGGHTYDWRGCVRTLNDRCVKNVRVSIKAKDGRTAGIGPIQVPGPRPVRLFPQHLIDERGEGFRDAVVASFIDYTGGTASDFIATIDWLDGSTSPGVIVPNGTGPSAFNVLGSHVFSSYSFGQPCDQARFIVRVSDKNGSGLQEVTSCVTPPVLTLAGLALHTNRYEMRDARFATIFDAIKHVRGPYTASYTCDGDTRCLGELTMGPGNSIVGALRFDPIPGGQGKVTIHISVRAADGRVARVDSYVTIHVPTTPPPR